MFVLISRRISEMQRFEISLKKSQPLILRKHFHDFAVQGRLDSQQSKKEKKKKKRNLTQFKTFLETAAPDKGFSKTGFSKYFKNRFRYQKNVN